MSDFEDREYEALMDKFKKSMEEGNELYFDSTEMEIIIEGLMETWDFDYAKKAIEKALAFFPKQEYFRILSIKYHLINMNIPQAKSELCLYESDFEPSVDYYKEKVICAKIEDGAKSSGSKNRISLLNKALKLDDKDNETHFLLASEYLIVGDADKAAFYAIRAMELVPDNNLQIIEYSMLCEQMEQYELAMHFFKLMVNRFPLSKECWQFYALALAWNKQYDEALDANECVLSINPDTPDAYFNQGKIYYEKHDFPNAIKSLLHAYDLDKTDSSALLSIAYCYELMEQPDKATEYYNRIKLLYPDNVDANLGIINRLCEKGQFKEARTFLEHQLNSGKVSPELIFRAIDLLLDKDLPLPETDEERTEEMDIKREEENYELIEKYIRKALLGSKDAEEFLSQFAQFCCYSGRSKIGAILLTSMLADNTFQTFNRAFWDYCYAGVLLTADDLHNGLRYLEHALCAEPEEIGLLISINHELLKLEGVRTLIERYV
jgi:tetratricopeptide (TPR) repeat protein